MVHGHLKPVSSRLTVQTIGRLSLYRRLLLEVSASGARQIYSHQLATAAVATPAQVRRDLMAIGFSGSPRRGYAVDDLIAAINAVLARNVETSVALVGVGNLGRAILAYFANREPWVRFTAAFDRDPDKVNRILHGCRVYPIDRAEEIIRRDGIRAAAIAVPASEAQHTADRLVLAGVRSFLNFAPVRLHVPTGTFVDDVDMTTALDRVAFYAHQPQGS
ncbi:MAG TPA: redox-sensing transcriptional repressor Rex [Vicinamibacterales bacterium]|nr:redox-sensing transcriptional repressor Rex [Vicinamibacterales bacterium]HOG29357.1 redox-sensing transcriptional repressor Rex [Vicinamibacterales bacterium]HOQ60475.1 redox-sensing transcriptional repressor Rex [Vicinamibacterales bacterium]HPK72850.1 redox-sensing transcriptional repressor Rex [Vicinamibacterales bacterium]HPW19762.1 redox-sensing transcriptional repressor Rex [Vicinamibacterales bacterium]